MIAVTSWSSKSSFLRPHEHEKPAFSNSSGLKSNLKQLRCDGLVVDDRPSRKNKVAFSNFSSLVRTGPQ